MFGFCLFVLLLSAALGKTESPLGLLQPLPEISCPYISGTAAEGTYEFTPPSPGHLLGAAVLLEGFLAGEESRGFGTQKALSLPQSKGRRRNQQPALILPGKVKISTVVI